MANRVVHEFTTFPNSQNEFQWPADRVTRTTSSSVALQSTTRAIVITTDTDERFGFDSSVGAGDIPILATIENTFVFGEPAAGRTVYFA